MEGFAEQTRQLHGWRLALGKRDRKDNMRIVASLRAATFDFRQFSTKLVSYRCLFGLCADVMPLFFWNVLFKRWGIFYSRIGPTIRGGVSMEPVSRRNVLAAAAAAGTVATAVAAAQAASFGNPDEPPQGAINTTGNPASVTDPGPQNPAIASQFPAAFSPPATNVGDMPMFWASFNNAPRRIQNGGWARQVTQADFAISEEISGVNMRLTRGGIRELHWHQAAEWAYVSRGAIRITTSRPLVDACVRRGAKSCSASMTNRRPG
jgi:hypothetical protein